jgi:hypothetical protein
VAVDVYYHACDLANFAVYGAVEAGKALEGDIDALKVISSSKALRNNSVRKVS